MTTFNVMLYLGIIEKRASELAQLTSEVERIRKEEEAAAKKLKEPTHTKHKVSPRA